MEEEGQRIGFERSNKHGTRRRKEKRKAWETKKGNKFAFIGNKSRGKYVKRKGGTSYNE